MPASATSLVGREREVGVLRAFLDEAPKGRGLLVEGDPGIGKTAFLLEGAGEARTRGYRVLQAAPAETETKLSFSALGDLFREVPDQLLDRLPPPQRRALGGALLRLEVEGSPPDRRTVSVAALETLHAMAREEPVLVALDDLQWLDAPSARALEYAARRLAGERVAFLLSQRPSESSPHPGLVSALGDDRLHRIHLGGLSVGALGRVLSRLPGGVLNRPMLLRVHRASGGNPLFAQEIARAVMRRPGPMPSGAPIPIPETLRAAVRDRVGHLPPRARDAVLAVATLSSPTRDVVESVLGPRASAAVAAAVDADALTVENGRLALTHPLVGSVLYQDVSARDRRKLHARLADAVDDPEERARHLALAAAGPDPIVAEALRRAAEIARARGAPEAAAELTDRAVELTPPTAAGVDAELIVEAADHHFASGDAARARSLLEGLASAHPPGRDRAAILWRLARILFLTESIRDATVLLEQAVLEIGDDPLLRAQIEQALAFTEMVGGNIPAAREHASVAVDVAERGGDAGVLALALCRLATIDFILGKGLDRATFERSVELESALDADVPIEWRPTYNFAGILMYADDLVGARALLRSLLDAARERGDEGTLPSLLFLMSELECRAGVWATADRYAAEALEASSRAGQDLVRAWGLFARALVDAHLGRVDAARRAAEEGLAFAQRTGAVTPITQIVSVLGFLELSLGDAGAAHAHLEPLTDMVTAIGVGEPGVVRFLPDEIEALIALGEIERARALIDDLEARARALDRPSALAAARRCRGLLLATTGDAAGGLEALDEALREHERVPLPLEHGRTLLVTGQVARRAKKWGDARDSLQQALELFEGLGAALWVERARSELARVGGRPPAPLGLTPTEQRVAEQAAAGRATVEIAEALFLSPKSVEASLTRIYRKLGVRSRTELAARMTSKPGAAP